MNWSRTGLRQARRPTSIVGLAITPSIAQVSIAQVSITQVSIAIVAIVWALAWPNALGAQSPQVAAQARKALLAQDFELALKLLLPLRDRQPRDAAVDRLLVHAYFGTGQIDESRKLAIELVRQGVVTVEVLGRLAQIDQKKEDRVALLNVLRLLIVLEPDRLQWRTVYAQLLATMGMSSESIAVYQKLVETAPDVPAYHVQLGESLMRNEAWSAAESSLETAWHLGHRTSLAAQNLAALSQRRGDLATAISWLENIQSPGNSLEHYIPLARLSWAAKDRIRLKKYCGQLIADTQARRRAVGYELLGRAAVADGDLRAGDRLWEAAYRDGSTDPDVCTHLAQNCYARGEFARAAALSGELTRSKDDPQLWHLLIKSQFRAGNQLDARKSLRTYVIKFGWTVEARKLVELWHSPPPARPAPPQPAPPQPAPPQPAPPQPTSRR